MHKGAGLRCMWDEESFAALWAATCTNEHHYGHVPITYMAARWAARAGHAVPWTDI